MSPTLLSGSRCHPSVLQLFPFSENGAMSSPRDFMSSQTQMTYSNETIPDIHVLAVSTATKSHTNCIIPPTSNRVSCTDGPESVYHQGPNQRIVEFPSEKFAGKHPEQRDTQDDMKSKNETQSRDANVSGTFRISLNDACNKAKDRRHEYLNSTNCAESRAYNINFSKELIKPLPKPTYKPSEFRKLHNSDKYHDKLKTTDTEVNCERQKRESFQTHSGYQSAGRIKFNVKELQRSKTPISDNDPDKLNMKHVIAFLQASNKVVDNVDYEKSSKQNPLKSQSQFSVRLPPGSLVSTGQTGVFFDKKHQIIKPNAVSNRLNSSYVSLHPKEIVQQHASTLRNTPYNPDSNKTDVHESAHLDTTHKKSSLGGEMHHQNSDDFKCNQNWDKQNISDLSQNLDQRQGLKSPEIAQHTTVVSARHMPPINYKHQTNKSDRSFRLHRLTSHLPDVSESSTCSSQKTLKDHDDGFQNNSTDVLNRTPNLERTDKFKAFEKFHFQAASYMPCAGLSKDSLITKTDKQSILKPANISNMDIIPTQRTTKIICLPTAHTEGESDEDISAFFTSASANSKREQTFTDMSNKTRSDSMNIFNAVTGDMSNKARSDDVNVLNFVTGDMNKNTRSDKMNMFNSVTGDMSNKTRPDNINMSNSVTGNNSNKSVIYQETNTKTFTEETNIKLFNMTCTQTNNTCCENYAVHRQRNIESADVPDNFVPKTVHQSTRLAFMKENQTRMKVPNSYQLNSHQKTFLRLLNQELAAMKRTITWQEKHQHLLSPLVYENKTTKGVESCTEPKDDVKLSLRKERNKTRVHTYMTDMEERCSET